MSFSVYFLQYPLAMGTCKWLKVLSLPFPPNTRIERAVRRTLAAMTTTVTAAASGRRGGDLEMEMGEAERQFHITPLDGWHEYETSCLTLPSLPLSLKASIL